MTSKKASSIDEFGERNHQPRRVILLEHLALAGSLGAEFIYQVLPFTTIRF